MMAPSATVLRRLRPVLLAIVLVASRLTFEAAPTTLPLPFPRPEALTPQVARAVTCATNPSFTGRLTASSASTTAVSRIISPTVYGYISNVDGTWSCTASVRYSGIAWNATLTTGTFTWGNLVNNGSGCNWIVGTTDYLKANSTSDCPDFDAEYAMAVTLIPEGVYHNDVAHDTIGDFSFAHSDCDTFHGAQIPKTGVTFSSGSPANRPDSSNCDPITLDGMGTAQTVTYDASWPTIGFDWPTAAGPTVIATAGVGVGFDATDVVAGFDATHQRTLQRQRAAWTGACGTFAETAAKLTTACTSSPTETYAYDIAGNRTQTVIGGTTTKYGYNGKGQLCKVGATGPTDCASPNVTYDPAGRTATWNGWTFTYEGEGRLASACKVAGCATGDKVTMRYDGEGRRVELVVRPNGGSATTTTFRYQGAAVAQELTNGTVSREYATDERGAIVKVCDPSCVAPTTTYLVTWNGHGDALGLWRINADGTLTLANSYTYTNWGTPTTTVTSGFADLGFRFLYVGAADVQWDDFSGLGLAYMHARHYSPSIGRFLQPDPARGEANSYGYAVENPVTLADPTGTFSLDCWDLLQGITELRNELVRRYMQIRLNIGRLPAHGRFSVEGHRRQFTGKQSQLRRLLQDYTDNCRNGPRPPGDCWKWATRPAPWPARPTGYHPPAPPGNNFWAGAAAAFGTVVSIWWGLKVLTPACGPFAPVCAVGL